MKTLNKKLASMMLAIGNQIYLKHSNKMNWEEHASIVHWYTPKYGHMGSRNDLYFQFEVDHNQKDENGFSMRTALKYFRYSPESKNCKGWDTKIFDINIGASGYCTYDNIDRNKVILMPDRFWFIVRLVPLILFMRWLGLQLRKTKVGRNLSWMNRMCKEFGYSIHTLHICTCRHENMNNDSMINGDTGQEWLSCPDCGYHQHIAYY